MHLLSSEAFEALDGRPLWLIELPYRADQEIALDLILWTKLCIFATTGGCDFRPPLGELVVPSSLFYGSVEAYVLE